MFNFLTPKRDGISKFDRVITRTTPKNSRDFRVRPVENKKKCASSVTRPVWLVQDKQYVSKQLRHLYSAIYFINSIVFAMQSLSE